MKASKRKKLPINLDGIHFGSKMMEKDIDSFCNLIFHSTFALSGDSFWDRSAERVIKATIIHLYYKTRKVPIVSDVVNMLYDFDDNYSLNRLVDFPHISKEEFLTNNPLKATCGEYISDIHLLGDFSEYFYSFFQKHNISHQHFCKKLSDIVSGIKKIEAIRPLDFTEQPFCVLLTHPTVRAVALFSLELSSEARNMIVKRAVSVMEQ